MIPIVVAWRVGTNQSHQTHSHHHHGNLDASITNLNLNHLLDDGHHKRRQRSRTWAALAVQARIAPRREQVAQLYGAGTWPLAIADQLDVAPEVVYADLTVLGLSPGKRRIDERTKRQIISMRKAGRTAAEITCALGVSSMTIRRHAGQAGIVSRRQGEQTRRQVGIELLRRYRPEWSYTHIAQVAGVNRATVYAWATEEGLQQGDPQYQQSTTATDSP